MDIQRFLFQADGHARCGASAKPSFGTAGENARSNDFRRSAQATATEVATTNRSIFRTAALTSMGLLLAGLLIGCVSAAPVETGSTLPALVMTEEQARAIAAQSACAEVGPQAETAFFNPVTGTWWIDLAAEKPGCAPACVVDVTTQAAEVNWRCTGLVVEAPAPTPPPSPTPIPPTPTAVPLANLAASATASASSVLPADRLGRYEAASVIDGSLSTPWCEGAQGSGIGQWIELTFPAPIEVSEIGVDVGYDRAADDAARPENLFTDNHRLKQASLIFSDAQQAMVVFKDIRGVQKLSLADAPGGPIVTTTIRLIIDDVYPGKRFNDACIAEIEVWGRTQ